MIQTPFILEQRKYLVAGEFETITGIIYTARDAAHEKLVSLINEKKPLPFDMNGAIIYYVGPTPEREGEVIGSAGPTSSYRMDYFLEPLFKLGLAGTIGKGPRTEQAKHLHNKYKGIYFSAIGGTGAKLSKHIISSEIIAFDELGTEAIRKLEVKDFPVIVTYDLDGNDAFER